MLLPISFALAGNFSSHIVKQCWEIAGIFDLSGNIFAPAGIIWSVVMLSPTLRETGADMLSSRGEVSGKGLIFGPLRITTLSISDSGTGGTTMLSLILNTSGSLNSGISPSSLGSVKTPATADAAATSGDTR